MQRAPVFDQILGDYIRQVAAVADPAQVSQTLGVTWAAGGFTVPYFDRRITITTDRIIEDGGAVPSHATSVTICKYLLLCPNRITTLNELVTYKDFRDAAPYVGGFRSTAEAPISRSFSGTVKRLENRCRALGGEPFITDVACQLAFRFQALPRVPLFLLFHDADEDFSAQCTLLFQKNAATYLDMECLAMIGATLAHRLVKTS